MFIICCQLFAIRFIFLDNYFIFYIFKSNESVIKEVFFYCPKAKVSFRYLKVLRNSMGTGKTIVEFFSAEMFVNVCK